MEEISNEEFFKMSKNGKIFAKAQKVNWEIIKRYGILMYLPFIIYEILLGIIDRYYIKLFNYFQRNIDTVEIFIEKTNMQSLQYIIISIFIMACNFFVMFFCSIAIVNRFKIEKREFKKIMKVITIIQLIFMIFLTFHLSIIFNNEYNRGTNRWRIEKLMENENMENIDEIVDLYVNKINNIWIVMYIILITTNVACGVLCVLIQKKILQTNLE